MMATFNQAAAKYVELEHAIEAINKKAKAEVAALKKIQADIENWFALRAEEEGLKNIPTEHGTVYWATHSSATVADQGVFRDFCINNDAMDLMETRASKTAVASYVESHGGLAPPGVNFKQVRVFNLRETSIKE